MNRTAPTYVASALFTPTVLWIAGLNRVLLPNLLDVPYSLALVAPYAVGFAICAALGIALAAASVRLPRLRWAVRVWVGLGLAVMLFDVATALGTPRLDNYAAVIAIDVVVLLIAAAVVMAGKSATFASVFSTVAVVLALQGVGQHAYAVWSWFAPQSRGVSALSQKPGVSTASDSHDVPGNVYHVLLDGFQSEVFDLLMDESDGPLARNELEGFTYYPKFYASYFMTFYALPHLFTGKPYTSDQSFHLWRQRAVEAGLLRDLRARHARSWLYLFEKDRCPPQSRYCMSSQDPAAREEIVSSSDVLLDLWFGGLLPRSLAAALAGTVHEGRIATAAGVGVVKDIGPGDVFSLSQLLADHGWLHAGSESPSGLFPGATAGDVVPWAVANTFTSIQSFDRMLEHEAQRPPRGQYVFIHAVVPHTPYVLDDRCAYKGPESDPTPSVDSAAQVVGSYSEQARCALRLVSRLVTLLRRLGRYDDSLIIVQSDHGMDPSRGEDFRELYPERVCVEWGNDDDVLSGWRESPLVGLRSHALLLVKPAHGEGQLKRSTAVALMADIAPTVLQYFGGSTAAYPGMPLGTLRSDAPREVVFYAGEPALGFFRGLKGPNMMFPAGNVFSKFVLEDGQWSYRDDVRVN